MAALIARLLDNGHAYATDDGSIFFRISSWPAYGALARIDPQGARVGDRVAADDYGKDDVRDFALWKGPKPGEPSWETEIGQGRPGWHIECSAMSMKYLGESFDIHTGGVDLIFPHHENEIAQSEAATGKHFVNVWLHNSHLVLSGVKMARRVGNISRPAEVYEDGYTPADAALRADRPRTTARRSNGATRRSTMPARRSSGYRRPWPRSTSYTERGDDDPTLDELLDVARDQFRDAMDDDLNVSGALARSSSLFASSTSAWTSGHSRPTMRDARRPRYAISTVCSR